LIFTPSIISHTISWELNSKFDFTINIIILKVLWLYISFIIIDILWFNFSADCLIAVISFSTCTHGKPFDFSCLVLSWWDFKAPIAWQQWLLEILVYSTNKIIKYCDKNGLVIFNILNWTIYPQIGYYD